MNAPQPLPLADRILVAIAKATSQHPAHAANVLALVGGDEAAYWAAIEQLTQERRINTAQMFRPAIDSEKWLAIWPTGVCLPPPPLSGRHLSGLFVPPRHHDLRAAGAPRTAAKPVPPASAAKPKQQAAKEPAMPTTATTQKPARTTAASSQRRAILLDMVIGRPAANGVPLKTIAEALGLSVAGVEYLIKSMAAAGKVAKVCLPGEVFHRVYDPTATDHEGATPVSAWQQSLERGIAAMELAPAPTAPDHLGDATKMLDQPAYRAGDIEVRDLVAGNTAPATDPTPEIRLALWDDGSLTIIDGDDILQYGPHIVRRLALLLGVPGTDLRPELRS